MREEKKAFGRLSWACRNKHLHSNVAEAGQAPAKSEADESAPWPVHLRGRPSSVLSFSRLAGDKCELLVNASKADTAESLLCKAEQQGLPANSFDVVFNGCKLGSTKPLVAYGVSKGSVLELVPVDTPAPAPDLLCAETPPLSSPHHALVCHLPHA